MIAPIESDRPRGHLFVCGVRRSGTTALARCLNRHRRIALGVERYRHAFVDSNSAVDYRGLFDKDRFFDFRPSDRSAYAKSFRLSHQDTDPKGQLAQVLEWPKRLYDDAREKYDSVYYVGDKIPDLYRRTPFLREKFPGCKVIFLLRNPLAIGLSWQVRADNTRDKWSHRAGFAEAVVEWNKALTATMLAKTVLGDDLTVVLFEEMFATHGLRRLLSRLDLDDGEMDDIGDLVKMWQRVAGQDLQLHAAQRRYVEEHADYSTYEWFKKEAQT